MEIHVIKVGAIDTNCYILVDKYKTCWLIDPGNDADKIIKKLNSLQAKPSKILLTHGHFDHIEAVSRLKQIYSEIIVYMHVSDKPFITNNSIWESYLGRPLISASYDQAISDGDIVEEGELRSKVIYTPGHSPGSVCYLIGTDLFSGDTVFAYGGIGRTDLWSSSASEMRMSLKKIFSLEEDYNIYPGHGSATTLGREKAYRS